MSSILTNHEGEIFVPTLLNLNSFSAQSPYPDILLQCPTIYLLTIFFWEYDLFVLEQFSKPPLWHMHTHISGYSIDPLMVYLHVE